MNKDLQYLVSILESRFVWKYTREKVINNLDTKTCNKIMLNSPEFKTLQFIYSR